MPLDELVILLPCHSLEDFPLHAEGDRAEGLLAAWSALWHPALLVAAGKLPQWYRADTPPEEPNGRLIVVPEVSEYTMPDGWLDDAQARGAHVVRHLVARHDFVAAALLAESVREAIDPTTVDADLAADFLALGFCYLQVELLTRQMRYMSNLDEVTLATETLAAARAAVEGDLQTARDRLRNSFDVLLEARERFYPVECYLVDLTLVAETTLGPALAAEVTSSAAANLVLPPYLLDKLADEEPGSLAALREAVDAGRATVCTADYGEVELALLPPESRLAQLARGARAFERQLGRRPTIFARRRFGLSPELPQWLARLGFDGAIHLALDEGRFPRGQQSKLRWEGIDGTTIDALARLPLDARSSDDFLALPARLGDAMDHDHVATILFAHWPGGASYWYHDLRRINSYVPVLGRFITLDEYFQHTAVAGRQTRFKADQYRAPYLLQAVAAERPDPISRVARHAARRARCDAADSMQTLATLLTGDPGGADALAEEVEVVFASGARSPEDAESSHELELRLTTAVESSALRLAAAIGALPAPASEGSGMRPAGYLVLNPLSWPRRAIVDTHDEDVARRYLATEVPPLGFAWVEAGSDVPALPPARAGLFKRRATIAPIAAENVLANEHVRVTIDESTGGIRALFGVGYRGNRLSQQLALRLPASPPRPGDVWRDPDETAVYSTMVADSVEITSPGPPYGEMTSRGRLVAPEGHTLTRFEQCVGLVAGERHATVDVSLECDDQFGADPWNSYLAARFAWPDVDAELFPGADEDVTSAKRIAAPQYVELRFDGARTTILAPGLPYHRRVGDRTLDMLLLARGERQRQFRFGLGVELAHPVREAIALLAPPTWVACSEATARRTGWLFHIDARHVIATHWSPLVEEGRVAGFRARLLETAGRDVRAALRSFRPVGSARQTDFLGQTLAELRVEDDVIRLDCGRHECVQVEARWRDS